MSRFEWVTIWREMRGSWRHISFFLVCVAVGVGALVGVGSLSAGLDRAVQDESRSLMAGDLEIRSTRPLSDGAREVLDQYAAHGIETVTVRELLAMASNPGSKATQLVELKSVGEGYPFYGELVTDPPRAGAALPGTPSALVEESLLFRLGLGAGDALRLGEANFRISGIILSEPDRAAGAFSLGPRVMISQSALQKTGLLQSHSRVRVRTLLRLPPAADQDVILEELRTHLKEEKVRIIPYQEARPRLRRFLDNLDNYLGLAGLAALLVGGIGVASSVRIFLQGKLDSMALLKCLGTPNRVLLRIYLFQTLILAGLGSLLGVALGLSIQPILTVLLSDLLPTAGGGGFAMMNPSMNVVPVLQGMAMGLFTALLFSLWPLLGIRHIPPARIFRRELQSGPPALRGGGRRPWFTAILILLGWVGLVLWQAGSMHLSGWFLAVLMACTLFLWWGGRLTIWLACRMRKGRGMILRHGISNLYRPGNQTLLGIFSIGMGMTVILALYLVQDNLMSQIRQQVPEDAPAAFLLDIQHDQRERLRDLLSPWDQSVEPIPVMRARLHAVDGEPVSRMDLEGRRDAWYFHREYVVTTRPILPRGNTLLRGVWWEPGELGPPRVSVEEDAAHHLGIDQGSDLTFDLQGDRVTASVASIREVDWGNFSTNFFIIFSPGSLPHAPTAYVATVHSDPAHDQAVQQAVVSEFPNITVISLRHVLDTVRAILQKISRTIHFLAAFTLAAGLVVLFGALAATRHWRNRESVLLKMLGTTRSVVSRIFATEYAVMGLMAGLLGAAAAGILSYVVVRWIMDIPWQFQPGVLLGAVLLTILGTSLVGFAATYRVLGQSSLKVLRSE